jgi:hypothetical protein
MSLQEAVYSNKNDEVCVICSFMTVLHTFVTLYISGHINSGLPIQHTEVMVSKIHDESKINPQRLGFEVSF